MPDNFGKRLRRLLQEKKITQQELADALDIPRNTVWRWINDKATPRGYILLNLATFLHVSVDELLNDSHDNNSWTINIRCVAEFKDEVINLKKNVSPVTDIAAGPAGCTFTITAPWEKLKSVDGLKELCDLIIGSYPVIESNGIFVGALPKKKEAK